MRIRNIIFIIIQPAVPSIELNFEHDENDDENRGATSLAAAEGPWQRCIRAAARPRSSLLSGCVIGAGNRR